VVSTVKKKHHYVPQGYLANFCNEGRLWVRDCEKKENRRQRTEEVAAINHYYSIYRDGKHDPQLENDFAGLEALALPIINAIHQSADLSRRDKSVLSIYAAIQWLRVPDYQRTIEKPLEQHALGQAPEMIR
jgi:hypothetical protein